MLKPLWNFTRKIAFSGLVVCAFFLTAATIFVSIKHMQAEAVLDNVNFEARYSSGATFYATKKRLFLGQQISREEIVRHLQSITFLETDDPLVAGSYQLIGNDSLTIVPRLPEFQPISVKFRGKRIVELTAGADLGIPGSAVPEVMLEPEPLGSFILSIDGNTRSKMFVRRYMLHFEDFDSTHLFYSLLASEDTSFLSHNGTRFDRILLNLLLRRSGGGSSITAQVIKNAVSLNKSRAVTRKIDELFLASSLESRMTKSQILTLYADHAPLGGGGGYPNIYGFLAAAKEYFGRNSISELTLSESATLVAMLPKPNAFLQNVRRDDYHSLTQARNRVLRRLGENWPDKYSDTILGEARRQEVRFVSNVRVDQPLDILSRAFVDYATQRQPLSDLEELPVTAYSGLHVYTSVDPDLMREAHRILAEQIPKIQRRFPAIQSGNCSGEDDQMLGSLVALNPRSGEIVAMAGGTGGADGVQKAKFALNALAAPASTVKPFWVVDALSNGLLPDGQRYTAASLVGPNQDVLHARVRSSLARSDYGLALVTLNSIGRQQGIDFYERLSGNNVTTSGETVAVGIGAGMEISPLALARAYTIFANHGALTEITPISEVYLDGRALSLTPKKPVQVVDGGAAFITAQMLRSVIGYGFDGSQGTARQAFVNTGLAPQEIQIGGKTGSGPHEVWMISVSPNLVVAVLLTYRCHSPIRNAQELLAKDTAAAIWAKFIREVKVLRRDLLAGSFQKPPNVIEVAIDPQRGCRIDGSHSVKEFFLVGTEPTPCTGRNV